jgi:hypothetical protein
LAQINLLSSERGAESRQLVTKILAIVIGKYSCLKCLRAESDHEIASRMVSLFL